MVGRTSMILGNDGTEVRSSIVAPVAPPEVAQVEVIDSVGLSHIADKRGRFVFCSLAPEKLAAGVHTRALARTNIRRGEARNDVASHAIMAPPRPKRLRAEVRVGTRFPPALSSKHLQIAELDCG